MTASEKEAKTLYPNLVLAGTRSANGRYYPEDVLRSAVTRGLYDGVPVFLDHDEKIQALVGQVVRAWWDDEKKCVRGDVRLFASSPFAEVVRYVFDRWGDSFGFSHVVEADVEEEDNQEVVKGIKRVRSVDLVVDPATTKGLRDLQEKLMEAKQRQLRECHQQPMQTSSLEGVLRAVLQSYWNGEIGFGQTLSLLSRVLGVENAQTNAVSEGEDMPKKKKNYESSHEGDKEKKMKEQEDTKKQSPDGGDEKIDMEDEDIAVEQDEETMDTEEEEEDETLEEQEEEESDADSDEEVEEQEEDSEDSEDEEDVEEVEEEEDEEEEEDLEEMEEGEEDEEDVLEEDEDKKPQAEPAKKTPSACESKSKKVDPLKRKLAESRKLLRKIVAKRYLPTVKEFKIIENSKDPVGVYEILAEAKKKTNTGKPKTLAESRKKNQEDEWDRMIKEVRRRKGLIR